VAAPAAAGWEEPDGGIAEEPDRAPAAFPAEEACGAYLVAVAGIASFPL
jgi:hypothetical protein